MINGIPDITSRVPQVVQAILTAVNGFGTEFVTAGENMVRGIWQGFQNLRTWLENQVRQMMREIVAAIQAEMQISSPSRVFAGIGEDMAAGIGVGYGAEMLKVQKSILRATDAAVPKPPRPKRGDPNNNGGGVTVNQYMQLSEMSYAQQQREAAKNFRQAAREVCP
jgi:hypothetical protein